MNHKNKLVKTFILSTIFSLFYFIMFNYAFADNLDRISNARDWQRAKKLKWILDLDTGAVSRSDKARFDYSYNLLRQRFNELISDVNKIREELNSHNIDLSNYEKDYAQYRDSCLPSVKTEADLRRCRAWAKRGREWYSRIIDNSKRLQKLKDTYDKKEEEWLESIKPHYIKPVEAALYPKIQKWIFRSGKQEAAVDVRSNGSFDGKGWSVKVWGCVPPTYILEIDGKFEGMNVRFYISGKGCSEKSVTRGNGSGMANAVFPNAGYASGTFGGKIIDPLMQKRIVSASSLTELKRVVSRARAISSERFELLVRGISLPKAKKVVLGELSRDIAVTPWEAYRVSE